MWWRSTKCDEGARELAESTPGGLQCRATFCADQGLHWKDHPGEPSRARCSLAAGSDARPEPGRSTCLDHAIRVSPCPGLATRRPSEQRNSILVKRGSLGARGSDCDHLVAKAVTRLCPPLEPRALPEHCASSSRVSGGRPPPQLAAGVLAWVVIATACGRSGVDGTNGIVQVPDELTCPRCAITLETDLTLNLPPGGSDGFPVAVRTDARGRYWVLRSGEMPALLDERGAFLQALGRQGHGPGEYVRPTEVLAVPGDSLVVLDVGNGRATLLDGNLVVIRSLTLRLTVSSAVIRSWPDFVIASGSMHLDQTAGPLYRLSFGARDVRVDSSFRMDLSDPPPEMYLATKHHFTQPDSGRFWEVWTRRYRLAQRADDGSLIRVFERRPSWFSGVAPLSVGSHDLSPPVSHELSPPGCRGRVTGFKLPWWSSAVQSSSRV